MLNKNFKIVQEKFLNTLNQIKEGKNVHFPLSQK